MRIRHKFISTKTDGVNNSEVRPNEWNEDHTMETTVDSVMLGRKIGAGPGEIEELPIKASLVSVLLDAFTGYFRPPRGTTAQRPTDMMPGDIRFNTDLNRIETWDGITWQTVAVGSLAFSGALMWTFINLPPPGWISFIGSIGRPGAPVSYSNDDARNLYDHCWASNPAVFPMTDGGGRGAGQAADWNANRGINFPDWRGYTFAIAESMGGLPSPLVLGGGVYPGFSTANLLQSAGNKQFTMTINEMPTHTHDLNPDVTTTYGGPPSGSQFDGAAHDMQLVTQTEAAGNGAPFGNVQPTVCLNCFVKL